MVSQFSSNEAVSLEKQIDTASQIVATSSGDVNTVYEIQRCTEWISANGFKKVCLQFPDHLLNDSSEVALQLQECLGQSVYILGDTAYESCCVDYVAAAHIDADAIIHFGPVCFSKAAGNIPCLYIYEKHVLDVQVLKCNIGDRLEQLPEVIIVVDTPYLIHLDDIKNVFNASNISVHPITDEHLHISNQTVLFIGNLIRKITNFSLIFKPKELLYYNPSHNVPEIINYEQSLTILKRRYFLIEKVRDSRTIGIIIGTVAVKNYMKVIQRMKQLITLNNKKYYVISVGKPTVAKLANFPEIDVYVVISCAMNEIYDSRDFYKPIVTPFDVESALNPKANELQFSYDYNSYLPGSNLSDADLEELSGLLKNDVSLLSGKIRSTEESEDVKDNAVALKVEGTVGLNTFGAGFLANRSWKGLEQNLGCDMPEIASEGRQGLAQAYVNEK